MVTGIDSFKEWFKGSEEQYAIQGLAWQHFYRIRHWR